MKIKVVDVNGKEIKKLELSDEIFGIEPNRYSIYEAIKNELANARQGTVSTKTKAEVVGSGAKPWKQKGTGRARVGTKRNPVWTHGGVAFGPKPRDFSYVLPKKVKRLAYRSVFSMKIKEDNLVVIDKIELKEGKTKEFLTLLKNIIAKEGRYTLVLTDKDLLVKRAARNLPFVKTLSSVRMNVKDLFYSDKIVLTEEAILSVNEILQKDLKEKVKNKE
ncbi:MAG: 50S ribosomal protein L4 [Candidatus Methanofastidiosum methylothiophilum]|uniref:50S ribosomal protein L4 n=1 Tax=Candidatus Methanofastidiosum methylothiophilum TaxID=1705564 RepID=A0A150J304_9EURY|nr:MAG: 50S ribosomal protein L4 [Candidatus Methanofastidiosum methylthiophilus]